MQAVYMKNAYLETGAAQFDVSPTGLLANAPGGVFAVEPRSPTSGIWVSV
jgi:hypothetical protein